MKKIKLIFFCLIIIFSFNINIKAALKCNDGNTVIIRETGITSAGFTVKMPKCRLVKTGQYMVVDGTNSKYFGEAVEKGEDLQMAAQMDAENKGYSYSLVPKCIDPDAKVRITYNCKMAHGYKDLIYAVGSPCNETKNSSKDLTGTDGWSCTEISSNSSGSKKTIKAEKMGTIAKDKKYYCTRPSTCYYCNGKESSKGETCCKKNYHKSGGVCCYSGTDWDTDNCYEKATQTEEVAMTSSGYLEGVKNALVHLHDKGFDLRNRSISCTLSNELLCPIYKCTEDYINVSACTPDYVVDKTKEDAYCVNPGLGFPKGYGKTAEYTIDDSFDVRDCLSSYSTVECGYANILIETAYNKKHGIKVSADATNTALRLWGAHSGQRGYDGSGIANVIGPSCNEWGFIFANGNGVNVYKYTEYYIRVTMKEKFYDIAYKYDYIPPDGKKIGQTFEKITCAANGNNVKLGIMCGDWNEYRQGFDLFFNTLIGNSKFRSHLNELLGGTLDTKPSSVSLVSSSESSEESEFLLEYVEFGNLETKEVVFDCDKLNELSAEDRAIIKPYCQTVVYLLDEKGNRLKDSNGNVYDPIGVEKCIKGSGCTTETFNFAVCKNASQTQQPVYYKVVYKTNSITKYLRKLEACTNSDTNQTMFFFDDDLLTADSSSSSSIQQKILEKGEMTGVYTISCSSTCMETGAQKTSISGKNFNSCDAGVSKTNTFTSTVSDPSLKCIVNMPTDTKNYYDYSNYFGVNNNLCKVYCSDEVDYTFTNKINAVAGETFKFDLEDSINNDINGKYLTDDMKIKLGSYLTTSTNRLISSIISEKRTCVSQIYYSINFPTSIDWKRMYGISEDDIKGAKLGSINNISQLLTVLAYKSTKEAGRTEVLNQVLYDLFNCYFLDKDAFSHLKTPQNITVENVWENIKYLFGKKNNYGFDDAERICKTENGVTTCTSVGNTNKCSLTNSSSKNKCIDMQGVQYMFGAEYSEDERLNQVALTPDSDSVNTHISNVRYCKKNCLDYNKNKPEENYNYSNFINVSNINYIKGVNGYKIPDYNYALFDVGVNVALYNDMRFQTKPGSGYIVDTSGKKPSSSYLTLDKYTYPISKNALTLENGSCKDIENDGSDIIKRCELKYVLGASVNTPMIHTFYRKNKLDTFYTEINSSSNTFTCYIDVKIPKISTCKNCEITDSTIYRNVTPEDLFPNNIRYSESNWATEEGQVAKNAIETTSDELRVDKSLLDYSITLSAAQIKRLREYNSYNKDYMSEDIYGCETDGGIYTNCKSNFLDILRGTTTMDADIYGTIDSNYNGSKFYEKNKR